MLPGERLKKVRESLGLTQTQMGEGLGYKWSKVKDIETGKQKLTAEIALKIQEVYSVDFNWIMTGEGGMFCPLIPGEGSGFFPTLTEDEIKVVELMKENPSLVKDIRLAAMEAILKARTGKK